MMDMFNHKNVRYSNRIGYYDANPSLKSSNFTDLIITVSASYHKDVSDETFEVQVLNIFVTTRLVSTMEQLDLMQPTTSIH